MSRLTPFILIGKIGENTSKNHFFPHGYVFFPFFHDFQDILDFLKVRKSRTAAATFFFLKNFGRELLDI